MGTEENIPSSKPEKSCPILQEHPSFYPYPDWASIQGYYSPRVPISAHYFNATVVPGHVPHPYMWGPQPMISPFSGAYTVYPHGGVYSHPSTTHMSVSQEISAKLLPSKDRGSKKRKCVDRHAVSVGNSNAESEDCTGNGQSQSGTKEEESSTDDINCTTESGGSKMERSRCSDDIPNSERNAAPTISLEMDAPCTPATGKLLIPLSLPNQSPVVDFKASSCGKMKPCGTSLLPTSTRKSYQEERELKREKRKQSNRESARRSRLRKQAETEELAVKVGTLNAENSALRSEIIRLTEGSEKLKVENSVLMEKLKLRQLNQTQHKAPAMAIENLLSRIENPNHRSGGSSQFEGDLFDKSDGNIRQLLAPNSRTDSLIASS